MKKESLQHMMIPRSAENASGLIPVIGYARVSTWREEMISVEIQQNVVNDAAARRGRYVAEWIVDPDDTGRNFKRKVMRAIEIVEDGARPEREIWSWKFSRFGRNRHGVEMNLARIESVGGELISATEDVDARSAVGKLTRGVLLDIAEFESNRAAEQWRETHDLRRGAGLPATGGKRFGYTWHPRRIPTVDGGWETQEERYEAFPEHAELALEGLQDYNAGRLGYGKLAARWNELGVLNTRGRPWQNQTVRWYYDSGFGAGLLVTHRRDVRCADPGRCQKPPHYSHLPAEHEAIWPDDDWDTYQDRREQRRTWAPRAHDPAYILTGLLRCGECGAHVRNDNRSGQGCYAYHCGARARHAVEHPTTWIRRPVVEARVHEWLHDVRDEIDAIAAGAIVVPKPRIAPDVAGRRKAIEVELSKISAAIDRATEGHALGDIPRDTYLRTRDRFAGQAKQLHAELDTLPAEPVEPLSPLPFRDVVRGLLDEWDTISVLSARLILSQLIRRVELCANKTVRVVAVWDPADQPQPQPSGAYFSKVPTTG
ncbi:recombinase family protein [Streptomyces sp. NPDC056517]|uniref:recombinase family protein n=1 Tax=Streptomyces sp. NPDC056517 TaxID=3345848 RepID=UPI003686D9D1